MTRSGEMRPGADALNTAWELLATRPLFVIGGYTLAASPMIASLLYWLRAVAYEDRRTIAFASLLVLGGSCARAFGLILYQCALMRLIGFEPQRPLRGRTLLISVFRMNAETLALFGWPLVFPGVIGLMAAGTAVPITASETRPVSRSLKGVLGSAWRNWGESTRYVMTLATLTVLFWIGILLVASMLVSTILPSLLNVGTADLALVMSGPAWWIGTGLFAALFADFLHNVGCCALVKDQRARASGADLDARLDQLIAETGGNP